jgi:hypothetical protein
MDYRWAILAHLLGSCGTLVMMQPSGTHLHLARLVLIFSGAGEEEARWTATEAKGMRARSAASVQRG